MNKATPLISLFLIFIFSCSGPSNNQKETKLSRAERIKLKQYFHEGKRLYDIHCSNCHQADGSGLARLYPPLKNADYLKAGTDRIICQIRYGIEGEMIVNDVNYNMPMPEKPELTILEIAEISTYIFNEWGDYNGIISIKEVSKALNACDSKP